MYTVNQDGGFCDQFPNFQDALNAAQVFADSLTEAEESTFTVTKDDETVVASFSNRRIMGTFIKQKWGGIKGNDAINIGDEKFDATNAILLMKYADLIELDDNSEETDAIGFDHIQWGGPCVVKIVDEICEFFGVSDISDITAENFNFVVSKFKPAQPETKKLVLSICVSLTGQPNINIDEFVKHLNCSITSNTVGIIVNKTEVIDSTITA